MLVVLVRQGLIRNLHRAPKVQQYPESTTTSSEAVQPLARIGGYNRIGRPPQFTVFTCAARKSRRRWKGWLSAYVLVMVQVEGLVCACIYIQQVGVLRHGDFVEAVQPLADWLLQRLWGSSCANGLASTARSRRRPFEGSAGCRRCWRCDAGGGTGQVWSAPAFTSSGRYPDRRRR